MLTKWESLFLLLMTIPIMGHVVILPLMIDVAGKDAWISMIFSLPGAFALIYAILKLKKNHSEMSGSKLLTYLFGRFFGRLFIFIFIVYFLFLTVISFSSLIDMAYIAFLPETPSIALAAWFLIFFVFAALKGVKGIALTAGILTFIGHFTGHTVTMMDSSKKKWSELLPMLEFGWTPSLLGTLILTSIWVELLLLLFVPLKNPREKRLYLIWSIGVFLNALMMFSTTTGVITIFGTSQSNNFTYPALEIVRIISLGFIDRFDVYGLILMVFGVYIRCSLFLRIAYQLATTKKMWRPLKMIVFSTFTAIVFFATLFVAKEQYRVELAIDFYAYLFVLFPVPFILLLLSFFKRKRVKERA